MPLLLWIMKLFSLVPFYRKLAVITVLIARTGMVLGDLAPIMMYLLWLNIIPGLNCTSPWFQTHYHALLYPKTKGNKTLTRDKTESQHIHTIARISLLNYYTIITTVKVCVTQENLQ